MESAAELLIIQSTMSVRQKRQKKGRCLSAGLGSFRLEAATDAGSHAVVVIVVVVDCFYIALVSALEQAPCARV